MSLLPELCFPVESNRLTVGRMRFYAYIVSPASGGSEDDVGFLSSEDHGMLSIVSRMAFVSRAKTDRFSSFLLVTIAFKRYFYVQHIFIFAHFFECAK